ncbi:SDR family NAD(P)-dependent oxidoreductase [Acinetobacter rudis]|uniref:SDR family NAD(P)-dependent oxidoreductase n=1 Tax=Acinetobacter rudis TaxID=632955 RepID=A0AAW8JA75_9GAMM|nr:SDR family NAD(P)-dependent oxidoreductase [Acinetobacter rudis]MDQ8936045.1 SDR family NAD(P)-dependent oxidoreductase [Acinetobacter rudis]MDQ8953275.1 SDR family NAD(P)-dependent oxidoreductase [Acinetobacter rudis]MDQ9018308.1 SDR family NAD(P)-dependent oxidoreductase [Acinetobacter rudis]
MFNFQGKTVLITGASGGIAVSCIQKLYAAGAQLVLSDLNLEALQKFSAQLDPSGERVLALAQDVSDSAQAVAVVNAAVERFGGIDILIPCAGLYLERPLKDISDQEWSKVTAVNLDGVFYTIRAAIPHLRTGAAIVNVASMAGHKGSLNHAHYAASKGAVLNLTRTLALELAPHIRVNNVSPGLIDTPMIRQLMQEKGDGLLQQTPLHRLGSADEVADAVLYLASDFASFITGETLHVNGGLYIAS